MHSIQGTLDELGTPLSEVTFVVVDLETTGGSAADCQITEIGAVKIRAGEVIGELQTLVNPGSPIPAFISVLTGITDSMVARSPRIATVLPSFLEFARDTVLVAHNAPFDISFLKAAAARLGLPWPGFRVVDTAHLARQLVTRDEAPNRKLSTLAALFSTTTTPDHRALHDARATVDVLHALIGRVGNLGVHTIDELLTFTSRVTAAQRRKRHLADGLPSSPGVYLFRDAQGRVLYVGVSTDIKRRVRTYFTASEQRTRMAEMVGIAESVTAVVCETDLEARVRELRLIAEHDPRYNRRSRRPDRRPWIKITVEPFPRLSIVHDVRPDGATYAGPFRSRAAAESAVAALHEALPLRQCSGRLSTRGSGPACVLLELGRCGGPCIGQQSTTDYAQVVIRAVDALAGDCRDVVSRLSDRMGRLAEQERYEDAGALRDRLLDLVRGAARTQRQAPLSSTSEVMAARRAPAGGWELACIRYGRLAGTTRSPAGADPMPYVDALQASAEAVAPPVAPHPAAHPEETDLVLAWLEQDGTRLVTLEGQWTCPVGGAAGATNRLSLSGTPSPHGSWARTSAELARDLARWEEPSGRSAKTLHRPPGAVPSAGSPRSRAMASTVTS